MKKKPRKPQYRIRNWHYYTKALKQRARIDIFVHRDTLTGWFSDNGGGLGRPRVYADLAIITILTLAAVFHLPLRQVQGFAESILLLMGIKSLTVPDYTTLSRRRQVLDIRLPKRKQHSDQPLHVVIDSTGLKVFGEGEWKVRQHGYSKRRTWRKLHLCFDEATGEILAEALTENNVHDGTMLPYLLENIEEVIDQCSGDGAYDHENCYDALDKRGTRVTIPPRRDARIHKHGNAKGERLTRDENLRRIRKIGRKAWKQESGYHRRSLSETGMYRFKITFGDRLSSRLFESQQIEATIKCMALNQMTKLGMPQSYAA